MPLLLCVTYVCYINSTVKQKIFGYNCSLGDSTYSNHAGGGAEKILEITHSTVQERNFRDADN